MNPTRRARAWFELLRLPNLFTVPGDVLAGFVLATAGYETFSFPLLFAVLSSLAFYAGGLLLNDLVDRDRDRIDRPNRPLPSGRVRVAAVRGGVIALLIMALLFALRAGRGPAVIGAGLLLAVLVYNLAFKRVPLAGPLSMGLCRALSLLLGASVARSSALLPALAGAGVLLLYVAAVTHLARAERRRMPGRLARWMPPLVLLLGLTTFCPLALPGSPAARAGYTASWLAALLVGILAAFKLARDKEDAPRFIGWLIGALLFLQAAFCMAFGQVTAGLALVATWLVFTTLTRSYYAS